MKISKDLNEILKGLYFSMVLLDDIVLFSKDLASYITNVKEILKQISVAGLRLKFIKSRFA